MHVKRHHFYDELFEQIDGVSMASSLGPVLANLTMNEQEEQIMRPLLLNGTLKEAEK